MTFNPVLPAAATPRRESACDRGRRDRVPCYPADMPGGEWEILAAALPVMLCGTGLGGRPGKHSRRAMTDAMSSADDNGCKWRALPKGCPPRKTVHGMFTRRAGDGAWADIVGSMRPRCRIAAGREPEPAAAVIGSPSVRESAEGVVPSAASGFDGHKKASGVRRHLLAGTLGLLIAVAVSAADVQDRDGAVCPVLAVTARGRDRIRKIRAGHAGPPGAPAPGSAAGAAAPATASGSSATMPRWPESPRSCR